MHEPMGQGGSLSKSAPKRQSISLDRAAKRPSWDSVTHCQIATFWVLSSPVQVKLVVYPTEKVRAVDVVCWMDDVTDEETVEEMESSSN